MASKITKTLSFRVPIGTYNNLIKEVEKKGGNMTELLCSKILNFEELTVEKVEIDTTYLENQINSLGRTLEESKNKINYLENSNEQIRLGFEDTITNLQSQLEDKSLQKNNLEQEYFRIQENSKIRVETIESELAESNSQKNHFQSFVKKGNELEAELNSAKVENDSLRTQIGSLEQNLEKIKQENLTIEAENYDLTVNSVRESLKFDNIKKLLIKKNKEKAEKLESQKNRIEELEKDKELLQKKEDALMKENSTNMDKYLKEESAHLEYRDIAKKELFELRDTHNNQINELHEQISNWMTYSSNDAALFNSYIWHFNSIDSTE